MTKQIICIIGTSTSGKSSLIKSLLNIDICLSNIVLIPQTTCRSKRFDDDSSLNILSPELYAKEVFVCKTGIYGTTEKDFINFINIPEAQSRLALMNIGTFDIEQLKEYINKNNIDCKLFVICLRLNGIDAKSEKLEFEKNLNSFFKDEEIEIRRNQQYELIDNCFCNSDYLKKYVDLVLNKKQCDIAQYLAEINKLVDIGLTPDKNKIKIYNELIISEVTKSRILNRILNNNNSKKQIKCTDDEYIYKIYNLLERIKNKSPDVHTKVGCLIKLRNNGTIIKAFNSLPNRVTVTSSKLSRPEKYNWFICAERKAIYKSSRLGISLNDSIMYINRLPCIECAKAIVDSGIKIVILIGYIEVVVKEHMDIYFTVNSMFKGAGIELKIYEFSNNKF